jgi:serine/threonine protein kinase
MCAVSELGERIGPYRIVRRLGRGGMAEVFLATVFGASGFEKPVAIKTLLAEHRGDAQLERLLIEEARLGARLSHECLIGVHELGVDRGVYYVRMDWVDGADLSTLASGVALDVRLALLIAERVALALAYVHRATDDRGSSLGLVHRDVSPQNVLVSRSGEVKLGDFGIAKATHRAETTQANLRRGKYAYMSPEQVAREPLTSRSDQFGLGVMLYELLSARRPFEGESPLVTLDRIREAAPPDVDHLPEDVADLVLRLLARDPAARFRETEPLVRALAEARRVREVATALDLARWARDRLDAPSAPVVTPVGTRPITTA